MKKNYYVYSLVTADKFEWSVASADTLEELSKISGYSFDCLYKACKRKSVINNMYRVRKIDIRDVGENFNFEEYKAYCKKHKLKESNFASLQQYRQFCYGT